MPSAQHANGLPVSGATPESAALFDRAARELLCMVDDPLATIDAAIAASPDMPMAHAFKAWLYLLSTEAAATLGANECLDTADALPATDRERAHLAAARALSAGRWQAAGALLEDLSLHWPLDSLALQVGHQIDFFRGDSRMLRDRIARALPAWDAQRPGWHALLGMHAFGLEETGDYDAALVQGERAVELEPRDSWAWHAVAHVHEMRNDTPRGLAWLQPTRAQWSAGSLLATHNSWHLGLFLLEDERHDEVLALVDEAIGGTGKTGDTGSALLLHLLDGSSMLWRLHLRGVNVGDRFDASANAWAAACARGERGHYAFNDLHAMLAFVGAGRRAEQQELIEAQLALLAADRLAGERNSLRRDNATFTRDIGLPAMQAVQAFGDGDYARTVALLRPVRSASHRFGGSHAQRDVIDLTLLEAAVRSGDPALAASFAAERLALRPRSPLAQRLTERYTVG